MMFVLYVPYNVITECIVFLFFVGNNIVQCTVLDWNLNFILSVLLPRHTPYYHLEVVFTRQIQYFTIH